VTVRESGHEQTQPVRIDRLGEVQLESAFKGAIAIILLAISGNGNESYICGLRVGAKQLRNFVSVHIGQSDITEGHLGAEFAT